MTERLEATVTVPFKGVRDGEVYPVGFEIGDTVTGNLAAVAVRQGWADRPTGTVTPDEPKKVPRRGRKP